jgi:hypothetical protein
MNTQHGKSRELTLKASNACFDGDLLAYANKFGLIMFFQPDLPMEDRSVQCGC